MFSVWRVVTRYRLGCHLRANHDTNGNKYRYWGKTCNVFIKTCIVKLSQEQGTDTTTLKTQTGSPVQQIGTELTLTLPKVHTLSIRTIMHFTAWVNAEGFFFWGGGWGHFTKFNYNFPKTCKTVNKLKVIKYCWSPPYNTATYLQAKNDEKYKEMEI